MIKCGKCGSILMTYDYFPDGTVRMIKCWTCGFVVLISPKICKEVVW